MCAVTETLMREFYGELVQIWERSVTDESRTVKLPGEEASLGDVIRYRETTYRLKMQGFCPAARI